MSGSQSIIELKENDPYEMICHPFGQHDVVFTEFDEKQDLADSSAGNWNIVCQLDRGSEKKLTTEEIELLQNYMDYLA